MQAILEKIYQTATLAPTEAQQLAEYFFAEATPMSQRSAILIALKIKGVEESELTSFVRYLKERAVVVPEAPLGTIDLCGTGGDHLDTFNISTTAAFVVAAAGVPVAKHGNRKISSSVGSADLLERLQVPISLEPAMCHQQLASAGITFLFAPRFHPTLKTVMPLRQELATATLFNLMGPLLNPYRLDYQLVGTYDPNSMAAMAQTLRSLGRKRALVIHGYGGMDEANLAGPTKICELIGNELKNYLVTPAELGLQSAPLAAITGASPAEKEQLFRDILSGKSSIQADTVALNAGLALYAGERVATIQEGVLQAQAILKSGKANQIFQRFEQSNPSQEAY